MSCGFEIDQSDDSKKKLNKGLRIVKCLFRQNCNYYMRMTQI